MAFRTSARLWEPKLSITESRVGDQPLASFTSPVVGRHVGRGPGLVDKNRPLRVKAFLHLVQGGAGSLDMSNLVVN
jgi:hypothetical protein